MRKIAKISLVASIFVGLVISQKTFGQDIKIKIGVQDSIKSEILNETRSVLIHLPDNYNQSQSYPVLYRLDGETYLLMETIATTNRLVYSDEIAPEMIIVAIENTSRARDMWPVNNDYYPEPNKAGAEDFLKFIEKELIPFIDKKYQTNENRILCGQSLSAIFVVYSFLTKPYLFNSYIASSAGFPACEEYFITLRNKAFTQPQNYKGQKVFITNGLLDPLDPDGTIHQQLIDFSSAVNAKLAKRIYYKHVTYENEGHVPFHSLYDGLKFIFETGSEK
jgi:predicted alpha/beta superfamily hydrolase